MRAKSYYKIKIPCKPYIVKYLLAHYGCPLVFRSNTYFGTSLLGYLEKEFYIKKDDKIIHKKFDQFTTPLEILLPRSWIKNKPNGVDISTTNIILLNKHFEERFEEDLVKFCHYWLMMGQDIEDSIFLFCSLHNIEIDVDTTFEAMKKKEARARNEMTGVYKVAPAKKLVKELKRVPTIVTAPMQPLPIIQLSLLP